MHNVNYILWLSVILQGVAVYMALRLIPVSKRALAWVILSIAFFFMMSRRTVSLLYQQGIIQDRAFETVTAESIALLISLLLALGVYLIRGIFIKRERDEEQLRKFSRTIEHSPLSTIICDLHGTIEYVNPRFTRETGYHPFEAIGKNAGMLKSGKTSVEVYKQMWYQIQSGKDWRGEMLNKKKNGDLYWELVHISPVIDNKGDITHYVGMFEDITERIKQEAALEHQALHDALSGLPNRTLLHDRLQQAILRCQRNEDTLTLMMIDLDRFKDINDTLGHHMGDLLLKDIAERLKDTVRETDTVARLGGDEFAIVLSNSNKEDSLKIAGKVLQVIDRPFEIESHQLVVGASIGIVYFPDDGKDADTLLRRADVAMYAAKNNGGGFVEYTPEIDQHSLTRLQLMNDLRTALDTEGLFLCYQPRIDLQNNKLIGAEALLRWQHPEQGLLMPDTFLPLAEQSGIINQLNIWVLDHAMEQVAEFVKQGLHFIVSINLSARDIQNMELPSIIDSLLKKWNVPPELIMLEITESAIMTDPGRAALNIGLYDYMGLKIAIDDFGTGYSSLSYLKQLPVDELKIDKSFVIDMENDENDALIVRAVIDLAHNLNLKVTAEGIENEDLQQLVAMLDCDSAQGYHICKPLPIDDLLQWIQSKSWNNEISANS